MKYVLDNLTKIEYDACVDAIDRIHEDMDIEYTDTLEDISYKLDCCEYLSTKEKIALLKEVIDSLQDSDKEN